MAANYGGYDYSFVSKELDKFTCHTICTKVLRDPHITGCCGQVFCESCLNYWFTKHRKKSCPHCRAEGEEFQHFLDKRIKREVDSLKIYCTNKEEGCLWVGEVGSYKDHLESDKGCGYVEVECSNKCKEWTGGPICIQVKKMKRKALEKHLKNECYLRPYQCEYCGYTDTYQNIAGISKLANHYDTCLEFPLRCTNYECGKEGIKRRDMENHKRRCEEELVLCPLVCLSDKICHSIASQLAIQTIRLGYTTLVKRKDVRNHLQNECDCRPYQCEHCGYKDSYRMITGRGVFESWEEKFLIFHYDQCLELPLECPNKCGIKDIKRKDMEDHRSQCPEEPVQCPFAEAGCKEKLVRRELEQHTLTPEQLQKHLLMVMGAYKETKKTNETLMKANEEVKKALDKTTAELKEMKKKLVDKKVLKH